MRQVIETVMVKTCGPGLYDLTAAARDFVARAKIHQGLLTGFIQHTSASLVIQENADPDVLADLEDFMKQLVGRDPRLYRHKTEGPDDMPAHIRSALAQTSLSIPIVDGEIALGTWQAVYVFEHRDAGAERSISLHAIGE